MRIILRRRKPGEVEFGIIYGGIALFALVAAKCLPLLDLMPSCVFKAIFGVACPTCGATRSIVFLSQLDVVSSFFMNPLVCIAVVIAVLLLFHDFITLLFDMPRIGFAFTDKKEYRLRILIVLFVMVNWLYLIFTL
jgi:Protein of unknown function (DUF2752)